MGCRGESAAAGTPAHGDPAVPVHPGPLRCVSDLLPPRNSTGSVSVLHMSALQRRTQLKFHTHPAGIPHHSSRAHIHTCTLTCTLHSHLALVHTSPGSNTTPWAWSISDLEGTTVSTPALLPKPHHKHYGKNHTATLLFVLMSEGKEHKCNVEV